MNKASIGVGRHWQERASTHPLSREIFILTLKRPKIEVELTSSPLKKCCELSAAKIPAYEFEYIINRHEVLCKVSYNKKIGNAQVRASFGAVF